MLNESPYSAFFDPARILGPPVPRSRAIGALRRKCRKIRLRAVSTSMIIQGIEKDARNPS